MWPKRLMILTINSRYITMHENYQIFYTKGLNIFFLYFRDFFLLIKEDFYEYHTIYKMIFFLQIYQHALRFNAI